MTGSGTDATDTEEGKQHKKRICRKLNKEFIVYVGEEKRKIRLVECSDSNNLSETTQSEEEAIDSQDLGSGTNLNSEESPSNSNSEENDKNNKISNSEETDKSDSNSTESDKSAKKSNSAESTKESEESVEEIDIPPKKIPIYEVDSSNSENT